MRIKDLLLILAFGLAGTLTACISESESHAGPSQAAFDALAARVEALEQSIPDTSDFATASALAEVEAKIRDEVTTEAASGTAFRSPQATQAADFTGTVHRYPESVLSSRSVDAVSTSGYYAAVTLGPEATLIAQRYPRLFETADCTGTSYLPANDVSPLAAQAGMVFREGRGEFNGIVDDPTQYLMVRAGTSSTSVVVQSRSDAHQDCQPDSGTRDGYLVEQNDPDVTAWPSGPIKPLGPSR